MKAFALGRRSKWKDYVDLYFIIKDHYPIQEISRVANNIFSAQCLSESQTGLNFLPRDRPPSPQHPQMAPGGGMQPQATDMSPWGLLLRWCSMFYRHYAPPELQLLRRSTTSVERSAHMKPQ